MRILLITLFLYFICNHTNSQDKKISLGLFGSCDVYNYQFIYPGISKQQEPGSMLNFSVGLRAQWDIQKKISLCSGILFSTSGYTYEYNWIAPDGNSYNDPSIPYSASVKANYLTIPAEIRYHFISREKIMLYVSSGFSIGFLVNDNGYLTMGDGSKQKWHHANTKNVLFASKAAAGLRWYINKRLFAVLEPFVGYGLNALDNRVKNALFFGAGAGLQYYIK